MDAEKLKKFVGELKERVQRIQCDNWGIVPEALEEIKAFSGSLQQEQDRMRYCIEYINPQYPLLDNEN